jgi:hypothetical protein
VPNDDDDDYLPPVVCGFDTALKMYSNDGCIVGFVVMFQRNVLYLSSMLL